MPSEAQWLSLAANLTNGSVVGADPRLYGASAWIDLEEDLAGGGGLVLRDLTENLVDLVWTEEEGRPEGKRKSVVTHPLEFAGQKWEEKVNVGRTEIFSRLYFDLSPRQGCRIKEGAGKEGTARNDSQRRGRDSVALQPARGGGDNQQGWNSFHAIKMHLP